MPEANPRRNFLMVGARCPSLLFYPTLPRPVSNGLRSLGPNKGTNVDQAALKCVYLAIMSIDPTGKGRKRWSQPMESAAQRLRTRLPRTTYHKPKLTVR